MMTEGFFIRLDNGNSVQITEHETDIRRPEIATELGVPDNIFRQFGKFVPIKDRVRFLRWLLGQVPIARVRGHGVWTAVEYACDDNATAFRAIHRWGKKVCGPCMMLCLSNLKTGERINAFWLQFDEAMKAGKPVGSVEVTTSHATE